MKQVKNGKPDSVGTIQIQGARVPIYVAPGSFLFYATRGGVRYSGASFKQLEAAVEKGARGAAFDTARLSLETLDTARQRIHGRYEDTLRSAYISIDYRDDKDCYEVEVGVHPVGRHHSKDFEQESAALAAQVMAEVTARLSGSEWRRVEKKREREPRDGRLCQCTGTIPGRRGACRQAS